MTQLSVRFPTICTGAAPRVLARATPTSRSDEQMRGQNIVCFAKDWDEDPTSNNYVMKLLARENRVLWLNSIATRTPNLRSGRDLRKIFAKLRGFVRGPRKAADGLWVYTPIVFPFPHSRLASRINKWVLRMSVAAVRRRLGIRDFQLWVFIPTAAKYVGQLNESLVVYYVTDEYSKFGYVDGNGVAADDRRMCEAADVVFATAQSLVDKRRPLNRETHLSRHGVDHPLFARALEESTEVPADVAALPGPVIGYYGAIQHWLDLKLIAYLAKRHPEWSIALIGQPMVDVSCLREIPNVHLLGRKSHDELPAYCKGMSVAIIPHQVNELTVHMNPIKLREYLSAGLPVVSVDLPEVRAYAEQCRIARSYEQFEQSIEEALRTDSPQARRQRSQEMRFETWEQRVAEIGTRVMRVLRGRQSAGE